MNRTQTLKHGTQTQFNRIVDRVSVAQLQRALSHIENRTSTKNPDRLERVQDLRDEIKSRKDGK